MVKKWFLISYLVLALLYGIVGVMDGIVVILQEVSNRYLALVSIIGLLFFLFNFLAIAWFHHHQVPKLAHYFPLYHLIIYVLFFVAGILTESLSSFLVYLGLLLSVGEVIFVFYLFAKLKIISSLHRSNIFRTKSWEPPKYL
jgi:hypothetical protein